MTLQEYILESLQTIVEGSKDSEKFSYENILIDVGNDVLLGKFRKYFETNSASDTFIKSKENLEKLSLFDYAPWTNNGWERLMGKSFEDGNGIVKALSKELKTNFKEFLNLFDREESRSELLYNNDKKTDEKAPHFDEGSEELKDYQNKIKSILSKTTKDIIISENDLKGDDSKLKDKKDSIANLLYNHQRPLKIWIAPNQYKDILDGKALYQNQDVKESFNLINEKKGLQEKIKCYIIDPEKVGEEIPVLQGDEVRQVDYRILFIGLIKYYLAICQKFSVNDFIGNITEIAENIKPIGSIDRLYLLFLLMTLKYNETVAKTNEVFNDNDGVWKFVGNNVNSIVLRDFCIIALAIATMFEANFLVDEVSKLINLTGLLSKK